MAFLISLIISAARNACLHYIVDNIRFDGQNTAAAQFRPLTAQLAQRSIHNDTTHFYLLQTPSSSGINYYNRAVAAFQSTGRPSGFLRTAEAMRRKRGAISLLFDRSIVKCRPSFLESTKDLIYVPQCESKLEIVMNFFHQLVSIGWKK